MATEYTKLTVNLLPGTASTLRRNMSATDLTATDLVHRALAIFDFIETERAKGNAIGVIEHWGTRATVRQLDII